uniref:Cyclic nucleotide-binding domain-containing protein n=1 Tax=Candidatus Kentrum sp. FM TaxID=2126340 RepID=A0A450T8Q9_9GAMM|nr:MAG: hypothetical protein BECKFM1743C_GA0114222_103205 [Candidatus Kentron sp. FM]VFJ63072.1 MAG: hypothetical protein BECKFM1743A_GA0114220_103235 [Candidatus Kentron sp. FM]VFK14324.1 MAG: hypothetical protein BECKFM1743B_GA0114221_103165 [Candidatus Kentron sp. FM]
MGGTPVTKTIAALTDGEMLLLTTSAYRKMFKQEPELAMHLLQDIAKLLAIRLIRDQEIQAGQ